MATTSPALPRVTAAAAALLGGLALSACGPSRASAPTVAFDTQAASVINKQGEGKIDGHAFYRSEAGKVIYAAGEKVWLIPATAYADQRFAALYKDGKYVQAKDMPKIDSDPDYATYTRQTKAESSGRFTFDHVAPGDYYVATQVTWRPEDAWTDSGAAIFDKVTLTGKETEPVKVIVSGK